MKIKEKIQNVKTAKGYLIKKACMSCQFYERSTDNGMVVTGCKFKGVNVSRTNLCEDFTLHTRYEKAGVKFGKRASMISHPREYYVWRMNFDEKHQHTSNVRYKQLRYEMGDMYQYWLNNIKENNDK